MYKEPDPSCVCGQFQVRIALSQSEFRLLALSDVDVVAKYPNRSVGRSVIDSASPGQDPSNLPIGADDAEFVSEPLMASHRGFPPGFDRFDVLGMNPTAIVCVGFHASEFEAEDGLELRCPREFS